MTFPQETATAAHARKTLSRRVGSRHPVSTAPRTKPSSVTAAVLTRATTTVGVSGRIFRVTTSRMATSKVQTIASSAAGVTAEGVGLSTTTTPANPMMRAHHRRGPTFSMPIPAAIAVVTRAAARRTALSMAKGIFGRAVMKRMATLPSRAPRRATSLLKKR